MKPEDIDPLDDLLGSWQVNLSTPRDFNRHVWQHIAVDQADLHWAERLLSWLLVPRRLLTVAAAVLALGSIAGLAVSTAHQAEGRHAYFSALNPLAEDHAISHVTPRTP